MERREFERLAVPELDEVCRIARFLTRDPGRAEDLVQDVYTRALRAQSVERFVPQGGGMRPWLFMITRSIYFSGLQRERVGRKVMRNLVHDVDARSGGGESPSADDVAGLDWMAVRPALLAAMESMSDELRETVWMWAVSGLKYRDISVALGVPIGTVMSRLHRARGRLAEAAMACGAGGGVSVGAGSGPEQYETDGER